MIATSGLAIWTTRAVLAAAGEPAVPLDDTYIHFQYARSFQELSPLSYSKGMPPTPGATSLLWPALLAIARALGFDGQSLIWPAWALCWTALALLAIETRRLARNLVSPPAAVVASLLVLCFGGHVWFAASAMEVIPFAWLLTRAVRRSAELWETNELAPSLPRLCTELTVLAWLGPLLRPEGAVASLAIGASMLLALRGKRRYQGLIALVAPFFPGFVNFIFSGEFAQTTARAKWLFFNPYYSGGALWSAIGGNVSLFFGTLLNGELWSSAFVPANGKIVAWLALPALALAGLRRGAAPRAALACALGLAMLIPTTYESFLVNRLRYLWPFTAPWLIGLCALIELGAEGAARLRRELGHLRWLLFAGLGFAFARLLPIAVYDVALSAAAISRQQVSLGRYVRDELPQDALIGVNDTGAIAYVSGRRVFDVVGLTTRGEAKYWVAGPGSRFEHYERLGAAKLPSWFIVYPEWFAIAPLLGECPTERYVPNATILGGALMVACHASYAALDSGRLPMRTEARGPMIDELDVADLESEAEHDYVLGRASQLDNVVESFAHHSDGARRGRTIERFTLELAPNGVLVARLGADQPATLEVRADGERLGSFAVESSSWQELTLRLPPTTVRGKKRVEISSRDGRPFSALHYWSYLDE